MTKPFHISLAAALLATSAAFAGATSVNTFGVLKVLSTTTNTIVTIPWTDYSQVQANAAPIFSPKLVKPTNLTEGDTILWHRGDGTFDTWVLNADREWERAVATPSTAVIGGGTVENPCCTMLANPWAGAVKLNDLPWKDVNEGTGIDTCDTLIVPNGFNGSDYVYRRNGKWVFSAMETYTDAKGRVRSRTTYTEDITIPEGQGFWYVRRKPESTTLDWPETLVPVPEPVPTAP